MKTNILIIQGHPDSYTYHFGHALADAFANGAEKAGHEIRRIEVAKLDFPWLETQEDFVYAELPDAIKRAQSDIQWATHIVIIYPLWLGGMPAILKAFIEQTFRPQFAMDDSNPRRMPKKLLTGKSARVVVTMGMPAFIYRWYYRAHSLKSLQRNILKFCGINPVRSTIIGMVESMNDQKRSRWIAKMGRMGETAFRLY